MSNNNMKIEAKSHEISFMLHVLQYMKEKPATDWDRVAVAEGLKSATVAHLRFGQIKKRLEWVPNTSVSAAGSPSRIDKHKGTAKANTTRPRGKKALEALEEAVNNMGKSEEDVEDAEGDRETEATAEGPLTADKEGDDTLES